RLPAHGPIAWLTTVPFNCTASGLGSGCVAHLMPMTIESGPTRCSTRVSRNPASASNGTVHPSIAQGPSRSGCSHRFDCLRQNPGFRVFTGSCSPSGHGTVDRAHPSVVALGAGQDSGSTLKVGLKFLNARETLVVHAGGDRRPARRGGGRRLG